MAANNITKFDIELEASLLKALQKKENFDRFEKVINKTKLIPQSRLLINDYKKYYDTYHKDIELNTFYNEFSQNWHKELDEQDLEYYRHTVFPLISQAEINDTLYISLLEREAMKKIEEILEHGIDTKTITTILHELDIKKNEILGVKEEDEFRLSEQNLEVLTTDNGLTWFLPSLQAAILSHMPGQFILVCADSDTGKSAFCVSQSVHTFIELHKKQLQRPILYCTSEDTKEDLTARFLSCLYRKPFESIVSNYDLVKKKFLEKYNDELFIGAPIRGAHNLHTVRKKIEKYEPSLIVIDILDKLSASDNIQDLTRLYQDIRGIANDGFRILATSQSGNTSYQDKETKEYKHRKKLTDKDVANSKSGKQGAAYCMIMIGKDDDIPNLRYITTTKKKRGKHADLTCEIIDECSLYKELL